MSAPDFGIQELFEGIDAVAEMNRSVYLAHIKKGFTEEQAMDLTRHALTEFLRAFLSPLQEQIRQNIPGGSQ